MTPSPLPTGISPKTVASLAEVCLLASRNSFLLIDRAYTLYYRKETSYNLNFGAGITGKTASCSLFKSDIVPEGFGLYVLGCLHFWHLPQLFHDCVSYGSASLAYFLKLHELWLEPIREPLVDTSGLDVNGFEFCNRVLHFGAEHFLLFFGFFRLRRRYAQVIRNFIPIVVRHPDFVHFCDEIHGLDEVYVIWIHLLDILDKACFQL